MLFMEGRFQYRPRKYFIFYYHPFCFSFLDFEILLTFFIIIVHCSEIKQNSLNDETENLFNLLFRHPYYTKTGTLLQNSVIKFFVYTVNSPISGHHQELMSVSAKLEVPAPFRESFYMTLTRTGDVKLSAFWIGYWL